ncbi:hypothetical protein XELAEV_18026618mg [Xenopus laevis]|uniref:Uncharacterized protein n=1 Tax=Xenopus laevis TaxID=8355 RepID=A0A974CUQ8_XENLA|nr:hypothetical protein XELAEV_18026618mg [Xenopus laevis]
MYDCSNSTNCMGTFIPLAQSQHGEFSGLNQSPDYGVKPLTGAAGLPNTAHATSEMQGDYAYQRIPRMRVGILSHEHLKGPSTIFKMLVYEVYLYPGVVTLSNLTVADLCLDPHLRTYTA